MSQNSLLPIETLGAEIKARVAKGDQSLQKAEDFYISAGRCLAEAKERVKRSANLTWPRFLSEHCGLSRRRADDLVMIGEGRVTVAELRATNSARATAYRSRQREDAQAYRARMGVSDAQSPEIPQQIQQPVAAPPDPRTVLFNEILTELRPMDTAGLREVLSFIKRRDVK